MSTDRLPLPGESTSSTETNVERYGQDEVSWIARGERRVFDRFLEPGMSVVDLGCGTGRITRELMARRLRVWAFDLNPRALDALRASMQPSPALVIELADARDLPLEDEAVDAVVFAFNGLDFIHPERERFVALGEISRVLRPDGVLILSSHNPFGTLLSPRGLRSGTMMRWRLRYLLTGQFRSRYFRDSSGLLLYQASPYRVVSDIERTTPFTFELAVNRSGTVGWVPLLTLFSAWSYYVFRNTGTDARRTKAPTAERSARRGNDR